LGVLSVPEFPKRLALIVVLGINLFLVKLIKQPCKEIFSNLFLFVFGITVMARCFAFIHRRIINDGIVMIIKVLLSNNN